MPDLNIGPCSQPGAASAKRIIEGKDEMSAFGNILTGEQFELLVGYFREVQGNLNE